MIDLTTRHLKLALIIALSITAAGVAIWESHLRSQPDYYQAYIDDGKELWTQYRARVGQATSDDVILLGASRSGYNFNTHIWTEVQGIEPINLSADGKSTGPFFEDIVRNTSFNGTIILSITPVGWFAFPESWEESYEWINYYHSQTFAQKFNFWLSKPLERSLVMVSDHLDLETMIARIPLKGRVYAKPELRKFGYNDEERNLLMLGAMNHDSAMINEIRAFWRNMLPEAAPEYEDIESDVHRLIDEVYLPLISEFKSRGGKIIFVRHAVQDVWYTVIRRMLPREKVYDVFVEKAECPSYHFEDYEFMSKYTLPEFSHMRQEDARNFTRDMVNKMIADGHLRKFN